MRASELIYNSSKCRAYAMKINLRNWDDLFMDALEKIVRLENKGKDLTKFYESYFYLTLHSTNVDKHRKRKPDLSYTDIDLSREEGQETDYYSMALNKFLSKNFKDDDVSIAQIVIELSLYASKKKISQDTGYSLRAIYNYYNLGKKHIQYEYDRIMAN